MYIEVGFIYLIFCTVLNYVQNRIENKLMLTPMDKKKSKKLQIRRSRVVPYAADKTFKQIFWR